MSAHHDNLSDADFIRAFEDLSLDPTYFDHVGHLRLAYLYLQSSPLETAVQKTCDGIRAYADSLGASGKFHRTITEALVRIISDRIRASSGNGQWQEFIGVNRDLTDDCLSLLLQYYSPARLFSDTAEEAFLEPDKQQDHAHRFSAV